MGLPEKSAVGLLALGATALVVCALFFCGEARDIQQGLKEALTPASSTSEAVEPAAGARDGYDLPTPPDCPPAVIEEVEEPLATRAEGGKTPCVWYQRKGLKPVWMIRTPEKDPHRQHVAADRMAPLIRSLAGRAGAKPGSLYRTKPGDTLPAIALEAYGDLTRWTDIWLANQRLLESGLHGDERIEIWIPE